MEMPNQPTTLRFTFRTMMLGVTAIALMLGMARQSGPEKGVELLICTLNAIVIVFAACVVAKKTRQRIELPTVSVMAAFAVAISAVLYLPPLEMLPHSASIYPGSRSAPYKVPLSLMDYGGVAGVVGAMTGAFVSWRRRISSENSHRQKYLRGGDTTRLLPI